MNVYFQKLNDKATFPAKGTSGAAGFDLYAALDEDITILPRGRALIGTGWAMAIPSGMVGQICPRSGMAIKDGVSVANSPGTVDSDYRGEVKVLIENRGDYAYTVQNGQRVAQMVFVPYFEPVLMSVESLDQTERGKSGFGSTGV